MDGMGPLARRQAPGPPVPLGGIHESLGTYAQDAKQASLIEKEHNASTIDEARANKGAVEQALPGELERRRGPGFVRASEAPRGPAPALRLAGAERKFTQPGRPRKGDLYTFRFQSL